MLAPLILACAMILPPNQGSLSQMFAQLAEGLGAPEDTAELQVQDRVQALRDARDAKDIKGWLKAAMPRTYRLPFCPLHDYIISMRHEPEFGLEAPRGHAKTAIGCAGVALYNSLEEPDRFDYVLNVQGSEPKALSLNLGIKLELEQNEVLREVYGNQIGDDKWTDGLFVLKSGVVFHAVSTGQKLRGTNYRLRRPNWVRLDDAYEDEDINNPDSTVKKNEWIESTLQPMMAADRPTSYGHQGTAINDVDALRRFEERAKEDLRVKFKRFSAFDAATKIALWPELRTYEQWIAKRDAPGTSQTIFAREYMNERRDDSSAIVKGSWLKSWEFDPATLRFDRDHRLFAVYLLVDPSIGQKVENDRTGMGVLFKSQRRDEKAYDYWLTRIVNKHLTLNERILLMQDIIDSPPLGQRITKVRIEAVAGFLDFAAEARRRLKGIGVEEVKVVKDKISVLESKSWHFQNQRVHISTAIPKVDRDEMFNQMTVNHPANDDLRDMLLLGLDSTNVSMWDRLG